MIGGNLLRTYDTPLLIVSFSPHLAGINLMGRNSASTVRELRLLLQCRLVRGDRAVSKLHSTNVMKVA